MKTEDIVLEATYTNLTKIPFIRTALSPIYSILKQVDDKGIVDARRFKPGHERYFRLLETIELLRKIETKKYESGNAFVNIEKLVSQEREKEVINYAFGYTIKRGKKYLIDYIKTKAMVPFLRITNTYYSLALDTENLFYTTSNNLREQYIKIYPPIRYTKAEKFDNLLDQIVNADILERDRYYRGYDDIFKKIKALVVEKHLVQYMS